MALKHHVDDKARFDQQVENSRNYVLPFVQRTMDVGPQTSVMEIGCGEGGVLKPFAEKGARCLGVDLDPPRIDLANGFLAEEVASGQMTFMLKNVYDVDFLEANAGGYNLIILKDTIEHVPEQDLFIPYLKKFLKPGGQIFFGFPPWQMPFGGHQQVAIGKWTSKVPYYHLLPRFLYKALLKVGGESEGKIQELMEIRDTHISIERFEAIIKRSGLKVLCKRHYLINPIYRYKFGLKPRRQIKLITAIPYLRDFLTTCVYYTVG
jgi:SAM-dependent methyltransferase